MTTFDDTNAVQAAFASGAHFALAKRPLYIRRPVVLTGVAGGYLGAPWGRPLHLIWDPIKGNEADSPLILQNCLAPHLENVIIEARKPCQALLQVERAKSGPGTMTPTRLRLDRVTFRGNRLASQLLAHYNVSSDENNEHTLATHTDFYGALYNGVLTRGKQSKEHQFIGCRWETCDFGIQADSACLITGGTMAAIHTAIRAASVGDRWLIQGTGFESVRRLLETPFSTAPMPITFDAIRFAADALHPDGNFVVFKHAGPLVFRSGCQIGGGTVAKYPTIWAAGSGPQQIVIEPGISWDGANMATLYPSILDHRDGSNTAVEISFGRGIFRRGINEDPNCVIR